MGVKRIGRVLFVPLLWPLLATADIGSLQVDHYCSFNNIQLPARLTTFNSDSEAEEAIRRIMRTIHLRPNFKIMAADVPNAVAAIQNNQRYILYNQLFMSDIRKQTGTEWGAISILAHEIGHHLNSDTLAGLGSRPKIELEADRFSGGVLHNMGATLDESVAAMKVVASIKGSSTHPPRRTRLAAITSGWKGAQDQRSGKKLEPNIRNRPDVSFQRETLSGSSSFSPEMVTIPAGQHTIKCDPDHTYLNRYGAGMTTAEKQTCRRESIRLNLKSYKIAKNEVTVGQYRAFVEETSHKSTNSCSWDKVWDKVGSFKQTEEHPVVCVNYYDTQKYISWLNQKTGKKYRLPTAGEWEVAARAKGQRAYPWGSHGKDGCKYSNNSDKAFALNFKESVASFPCNDGYAYTSPVGALSSNAFGLNDMFGNAREWLQECYSKLPESELKKVKEICSNRNPKSNLPENLYRLAGGSWQGFDGNTSSGSSLVAGGGQLMREGEVVVQFSDQGGTKILGNHNSGFDQALLRIFYYRMQDLDILPGFETRPDVGFRLAESI